jgi:hypothetical protein
MSRDDSGLKASLCDLLSCVWHAIRIEDVLKRLAESECSTAKLTKPPELNDG